MKLIVKWCDLCLDVFYYKIKLRVKLNRKFWTQHNQFLDLESILNFSLMWNQTCENLFKTNSGLKINSLMWNQTCTISFITDTSLILHDDTKTVLIYSKSAHHFCHNIYFSQITRNRKIVKKEICDIACEGASRITARAAYLRHTMHWKGHKINSW